MCLFKKGLVCFCIEMYQEKYTTIQRIALQSHTAGLLMVSRFFRWLEDLLTTFPHSAAAFTLCFYSH